MREKKNICILERKRKSKGIVALFFLEAIHSLKERRNKQRRHIKLFDENTQRTSITRETFGWQLQHCDENGTTRTNSHTWHDEKVLRDSWVRRFRANGPLR